MELDTSSSRPRRLARTVLAVVLSVVAVDSLRKGNRLRGALAGVGAFALGYGATTGTEESTRHFELDRGEEEQEREEDVDLRCAACGEPIRLGQSRGPNEDDEIVHDACK